MKNSQRFRKSHLRTLAKDGKVIGYRASQWDNWVNENSDPEYQDVGYFVELEEAIKHADGLALNLGWSGIVEQIVFDYEELHSLEFQKDYTVLELQKIIRGAEYETIYQTDTNEGELLAEFDIVVEWSWEKYIGYAHNIHRVCYAKNLYNFNTKSRNGMKESDLANNSDATFKTSQTVLLTEAESKDLTIEEIENELRKRFNKMIKLPEFELGNHKFLESN